MTQINLNAKVWQDPAYFIAFGFGSGLMPVAPGTWGTLMAMPIYLLMLGLSPLAYFLTVVALFGLGIWVSDIVSREMGVPDYKGIVWDEVVGYLLTMFMAPLGFGWMLIGFVLFRVFDIWKPYPISWVEQKVGGGLGVMLDDVLAAIPAGLILQILAWRLV